MFPCEVSSLLRLLPPLLPTCYYYYSFTGRKLFLIPSTWQLLLVVGGASVVAEEDKKAPQRQWKMWRARSCEWRPNTWHTTYVHVLLSATHSPYTYHPYVVIVLISIRKKAQGMCLRYTHIQSRFPRSLGMCMCPTTETHTRHQKWPDSVRECSGAPSLPSRTF